MKRSVPEGHGKRSLKNSRLERKGCSTLKFFCWRMLSKFPGLSSAKLFRPVEKPCRCRKLIQSSISTLSNNHNSSHGFWRLHITWYWMDSWATRQAVRTPEGAVTSLNPLGCCMVLTNQCTESMPVLDLLYPKKLRVFSCFPLDFPAARSFFLDSKKVSSLSPPWGDSNNQSFQSLRNWKPRSPITCRSLERNSATSSDTRPSWTGRWFESFCLLF